jgi:hypothetical protein
VNDDADQGVNADYGDGPVWSLGEPLTVTEFRKLLQEITTATNLPTETIMPKQTQQSGLAAKYGNRLNQAIQAHADDETNEGVRRLPAGINNGIARLEECGFGKVEAGKQNAGEWYFRAMGVVVEPEFVDTPQGQIKVAGRQTSVIRMMCETKASDGSVTSQDDNIARVLNEMRLLGGDDYTAMATTAEDLEALAEALQEAHPYFRFSTSEGKATKDPLTGKMRTPRVWENWHGTKGLEDYTPPEDAGTEDATPRGSTRPAANGKSPVAPATTPKGARQVAPTAPAGKKSAAKPAPAPEPEEAADEFGDLDGLAELAEGGDGKAQAQLKDFAVAQGIDADTVDEQKSWAAVAELIKGGGAPEEQEEEQQEEEEQEEDDGVVVGKVYNYFPMVKKGNKMVKAAKAVEVEVVSVNEAKETVTLKSLDNEKQKYMGVPFAHLVSSEE